MKRFDLWKLSLLNVFSAPVRSILTVLGFAIGVAAILGVLTLGDAGRKQVQSEMNRLGIDRIWLSDAENKGFVQGTGEWISECVGIKTHELIYLPAVVSAQNGSRTETTVIGCSADYLNNAVVKKGQRFWQAEWQFSAQRALAGENTIKELGITMGDMIVIGSKCYEVSGILAASEGVSSVPLEKAVVLPLDELCSLTGGLIQEIQMNVPEGISLQNVQKKTLDLLTGQGIEASAVNMEVQMQAADSVIDTFVNVLKWVALICILVGGVGVMNILLVGVRERKREIGVMKSMGTTPLQICVLFLLEAAVYAVIGGFLGILLGMGLIDTAGRSIELFARANLKDCATVFFCALGTGVFFGVVPAFRASLLTCVDALRQE